MFLIRPHAWGEEHPLGAAAPCRHGRHRRTHPESAGLIACGGHHSPRPQPAHHDRRRGRRRLLPLLYGGKERVRVNVQHHRLGTHKHPPSSTGWRVETTGPHTVNLTLWRADQIRPLARDPARIPRAAAGLADFAEPVSGIWYLVSESNRMRHPAARAMSSGKYCPATPRPNRRWCPRACRPPRHTSTTSASSLRCESAGSRTPCRATDLLIPPPDAASCPFGALQRGVATPRSSAEPCTYRLEKTSRTSESREARVEGVCRGHYATQRHR
jgi:hypothetical protein